MSDRNLMDPDVSRGIRLFHYTSLDGFLSIIKNGDFWASDIRYMNDSEEYRFAFQVAKEVFPNGNIDPIFESLITTLETEPLYVVSLTEKGDDLGQWRGYTSSGIGISFAFSHAFYESRCSLVGASIAKCTYDPIQQRDHITNLLNTLTTSIRDYNMPADRALINGRTFWTHFGGRMKHAAFEQEDEWRILSGLQGIENFRAGKSMVIPYASMSLFGTDPLEFEEIIVGPNPNMELSLSSLERFLKANNHTCKALRASHIPFRSW